MKTIWKFTLEITDRQAVFLPENADILSVQMQGGKLCMWAFVNPHAKEEPRLIEIFGTGFPITPEIRRYIGTVQQGSLVWHVFECP